jgi:hypothetical protein
MGQRVFVVEWAATIASSLTQSLALARWAGSFAKRNRKSRYGIFGRVGKM